MHMKNEIDPFDDLQCEELVPENWEGSPEPEPLSEADLEQQWQTWKRDNPEQAQVLEEIEAFFQTYPCRLDKFK